MASGHCGLIGGDDYYNSTKKVLEEACSPSEEAKRGGPQRSQIVLRKFGLDSNMRGYFSGLSPTGKKNRLMIHPHASSNERELYR